MINTNKLRGIFAEKNYTQKDIARIIGVSQKTFYAKMAKGIFGSDEIQKMIDTLEISNPMEIFFVQK